MNPDTIDRPSTSGGGQPHIPGSSPTPQGDASFASAPVAQGDLKQVATEQFHQVADNLKETGADALQSVKEASRGFISEQKERIAACISDYTGAIRSACERLNEEDKSQLVAPAERAAAGMQRAAEYLRKSDANDLLHDLGDLARRRPEIVYGAMFVAGLATVRFLKASSRGSQRGRVDRVERDGSLVVTPRPEPMPNLVPAGPPVALQIHPTGLLP